MLEQNAGCRYDHYVLDQGSTDGTQEWLSERFYDDRVLLLRSNVGISQGLNTMLDLLVDLDAYDVVVKIDNDCELTMPGTLHDVACLAGSANAILSPRVEGLNRPPATIGEFTINGEPIDEKESIGGIFLAVDAGFYRDGYRYPENAPSWGLDDSAICAAGRQMGWPSGYVRRLSVNHYETTQGQWTRFPHYFARTLAEGKPAL